MTADIQLHEFKAFPKMPRFDLSFIPLTNGGHAICDEGDFQSLSAHQWFHVKDRNVIYAARSHGGKITKMHRELMRDAVIDHINGDGLDNRRINIRPASNSQNQMNRGKHAPASSIFKGVCWSKKEKKWMARIKIGTKRKHLGYFNDQRMAAIAYNKAAEENFIGFARLNDV